eukprot:scaffold7453_cov128-Isochrysis_galbana.AAC.12
MVHVALGARGRSIPVGPCRVGCQGGVPVRCRASPRDAARLILMAMAPSSYMISICWHTRIIRHISHFIDHRDRDPRERETRRGPAAHNVTHNLYKI